LQRALILLSGSISAKGCKGAPRRTRIDSSTYVSLDVRPNDPVSSDDISVL
jgi:hypothetical protein